MKVKNLSFLLIFATFLPLSIQINAQTNYYVSTSGDDSNNGSITTPFRTIEKLLNVIQPGDTGFIRGGNYALGFITKRSGTQDNPITIKAYPDETVNIIGTGNTPTGGRFAIKHDWYVFGKTKQL